MGSVKLFPKRSNILRIEVLNLAYGDVRKEYVVGKNCNKITANFKVGSDLLEWVFVMGNDNAMIAEIRADVCNIYYKTKEKK